MVECAGMDKSDKPKRRWFQCHLSTIVMLTIIAAGSLFPNVRSCRIITQVTPSDAEIGQLGAHVRWHWQAGWPLPIWHSVEREHSICLLKAPAGLFNDRDALLQFLPEDGSVMERVFDYRSLAVNALISILILVAFAVVTESIIRSREARKP